MTTVTTQTSERVPAQATTTLRTWKAREIKRLCQLPVDYDDPTPLRIEACISKLGNQVKHLTEDEDVLVTEEEDEVLKDIQRCEGRPGTDVEEEKKEEKYG